MSRLAETEWGRACEYVRKFAPFVGGIGECRALCEGGWNGDLPADLPDEPLDAMTKATALKNEPPKEGQLNIPTQSVATSALTTEYIPAVTASPRSGVRSRSNTLQVMDNPLKRELSRSPKPTLLSAPGVDDTKQFSSEPSTPVTAIPSSNTATVALLQRSSSPLRSVSGVITEEPEQLVCVLFIY